MNIEEQAPARVLRRRVHWQKLVKAAERIRGKRWEDWAERHGDWGRDGLMYVAVRYGGLRLTEVVREVRMKYQAAAQGVKRFGQALAEDSDRRRFVAKLKELKSTI